jgi:hypothetical protein
VLRELRADSELAQSVEALLSRAIEQLGVQPLFVR